MVKKKVEEVLKKEDIKKYICNEEYSRSKDKVKKKISSLLKKKLKIIPSK